MWKRFVQAKPYKWPYDGAMSPDNTALIVIDMQVDFCGKGGYVDQMGYDLSLTQAPIPHIKKVLNACREYGYLVIHTREGHRTDLCDLPANKQWRSRQIGAGIGDQGPCGRVLVRGEPGWEIIEELAPVAGEPVIDKPGKGSFCATDLDMILRQRGIRNVVLAGITSDVCVHTTMREANDRGYECLLLADCTAATDAGNHQAALQMVQMQGGVFGAVATSEELLAALVPSMRQLLARGEAAASVPAGPVAVVKAEPGDYALPVQQAALVMIDFQRDAISEGGYAHRLGRPVARLQACLPAAARVLEAARKAGMAVVHTLEGHKADLSDLPPAKWSRGNLPTGLRIGDDGNMGRILIRGEDGNRIVDEVAPVEGEKLLYKPGKGAFYATDLENWLRLRGITHLLFAGVTTEVAVQGSIREAADRGFESLLVTDASESCFPAFKAAVLGMIVAPNGAAVGWTATAKAVADALEKAHALSA